LPTAQLGTTLILIITRRMTYKVHTTDKWVISQKVPKKDPYVSSTLMLISLRYTSPLKPVISVPPGLVCLYLIDVKYRSTFYLHSRIIIVVWHMIIQLTSALSQSILSDSIRPPDAGIIFVNDPRLTPYLGRIGDH
jgi:hypothetical protein